MVNKILLALFAVLAVVVVVEATYYFSINKTSGTKKGPSVSQSSIPSEKPAVLTFVESLKSDTAKSITVVMENEGTVDSYESVTATQQIEGGSDKEIRIVLKSSRGEYYNNNIYLNEFMLKRTTFFEMKDGKEIASSADKLKAGQKINITTTIDALKMDTVSMKIVILE